MFADDTEYGVFYSRVQNWRRNYGVSAEWDSTHEAFRWCKEHGWTPGCIVRRHDSKLPFGPGNVWFEDATNTWDIARTEFMHRLENASAASIERTLRLIRTGRLWKIEQK